MKILKFLFKIIICFVIFIVGFMYGIRSGGDLTSSLSIASADEVATVAAEPVLTKVNTGWNAADYPTANLIPYPYYESSKTTKGVIFTVNSNGSVSVVGTPNDTVTDGLFLTLYQGTGSFLIVGKQYTMSGKVDGNGVICYAQMYNSTTEKWEYYYGYNNATFTWSEAYTLFAVRVKINVGKTANITIYPMLNAGETAYPYQPPFDLIWKDGYKVGYDNGYNVGRTDGYDTGYGYGKEDGYKEGYGDGISVSEYGVFYGANISGKIIGKYTNASQTSTSSEEIAFGIVNPTLVSGGFDFTYLRGNLQSSAPYGWMETEVTVIFKNIVPISMVDLMARGVASSLSSSFTFFDTNGKLHTAQWKQNAESGVWYSSFIDPNVKTENLAISRMTFRWSGGAAGLDVTISQDNIKYYTGYNQGYNEGLTQGTTEGYENGYLAGEEYGFEWGYLEGEKAGFAAMSETGEGFLNAVFSVFDVTIFGSLKLGHIIMIPIVFGVFWIVLKVVRG